MHSFRIPEYIIDAGDKLNDHTDKQKAYDNAMNAIKEFLAKGYDLQDALDLVCDMTGAEGKDMLEYIEAKELENEFFPKTQKEGN